VQPPGHNRIHVEYRATIVERRLPVATAGPGTEASSSRRRRAIRKNNDTVDGWVDGFVVRRKVPGASKRPPAESGMGTLPSESEGQCQDRHGCVDHDRIFGVLIGLVPTNVEKNFFWLVAS
jgi:hypothetical protein